MPCNFRAPKFGASGARRTLIFLSFPYANDDNLERMAFAKQLADLTGLDVETAQSQLIPFLETFKDRQPLINHLQDLLGPGAAQRGFIDSYTSHRFPAPAPNLVPAPAGSNTATPDTSRPASPLPTLNKKPAGKKHTKAKFPTKLPPPRKIEDDGAAFLGGVYRKGQGDDDEKWSYRPSPSSGTPKAEALPLPPAEGKSHGDAGAIANATLEEDMVVQPPTMPSSSTAVPSPLFQAHENITPTPEMTRLQEAISILTAPSTSALTGTYSSILPSSLEKGKGKEKRLKPCFCHARRHSLHPDVPMCPSCGLILCVLSCPNTSPLLSPPCPSCAKPLLPANSAARAQLLARLAQTLEELAEERRSQVARIRAERERAWLEKKDERSAFPDLAGAAAAAAAAGGMEVSAGARDYQARRREMDLVLGRAKRKEGEESRGGRVLRLDSKTHKLKGAGSKKGKKKGDALSEKLTASSSKGSADAKASNTKVLEEDEEGSNSDRDSVVSYDENDDSGPMPDPDDDGFLMHGDPPLTNTTKRQAEGGDSGRCWWDGDEGDRDSGVELIRYIAKEQRPIWSIHHGQDDEDDEAEGDEDEGPDITHKKTSVPGASK